MSDMPTPIHGPRNGFKLACEPHRVTLPASGDSDPRAACRTLIPRAVILMLEAQDEPLRGARPETSEAAAALAELAAQAQALHLGY